MPTLPAAILWRGSSFPIPASTRRAVLTSHVDRRAHCLMGSSSQLSVFRLCSRACAYGLLLGTGLPDDARTSLLLLILFGLYGAPGAAETVPRGAVVLQGFISGG